MQRRFRWELVGLSLCLMFAAGVLWRWQSYVAARSSARAPAHPYSSTATPPSAGIYQFTGEIQSGGPGRSATPSQRRAAISVIRAQLDAFRSGDYARAMRYQSGWLRGNYPSTDDFRRMITRGYPEFAHYEEAAFGDARVAEHGNLMNVVVTVLGSNGHSARATYYLVKEGNHLRITGVSGGARVSPSHGRARRAP